MKALSLLDFFEIDVKGIIHVGANTGQESEAYHRSGAASCLYIEPVAAAFAELQRNIKNMDGHLAVRAACSDVGGQQVTLHVANNDGESSSILPMSEHATLFPSVKYVDSEMVVTRTLDELVDTEAPHATFNLLVIDVQGAELKVLQGATALLADIDAVFVEVSEIPLYAGGCTTDEITNYLRDFGFDMKWMKIGRFRYGDAFYLNSHRRYLLPESSTNLALGMAASQSSLSQWSKPGDAQGGNNGVRTGGYGFHTDLETNPWWQVDLAKVHAIQEIRVFNRIDACSDRARTLRVLISKDGLSWHVVHDQAGRRFGGIERRPLRIFLNQEVARFVRLQLEDTQYLHLDEVEIYGSVRIRV